MHPSTTRASSNFQKPQARGPLVGAMTGDQQVPFQNQTMAAFEGGGLIKGENTGGTGVTTLNNALATYQSINGADSPTAARPAATAAPARAPGAPTVPPPPYSSMSATPPIPGSWEANKNLQNAQTRASSIFHDKSWAQGQMDVRAMTGRNAASFSSSVLPNDANPTRSFAKKLNAMPSPLTFDANAQPVDDYGYGYANGGKIEGPGSATSDSIPAEVQPTGEPIRVANGERILSVQQDKLMQRLAKAMGFDSVDAFLAAGTGKPVGPVMKSGKKAAASGAGPAALVEDQSGYLPGEAIMGRAGRRIASVIPKHGLDLNYMGASSPGNLQDAAASAVPAAGAVATMKPNLTAPAATQNPSDDPQFSILKLAEATPATGVKPMMPAPEKSYANGAPTDATGAVTQNDLDKSEAMISGVMGSRSGGDMMSNANGNIQRMVGDSAGRDTYNAAQKMKGSNIRVGIDPKTGGLLLTGATGNDVATKSQFVGLDGKPTQDYTQTDQYAEGVANAAKTKQLADSMQHDRMAMESQSLNPGYSIPARRALMQQRSDQELASGTAINAANLEGSKTNIAAAKLRMQQEQQQAQLMREYMDPNTTDTRRSELAQFFMLGKTPTPRFAHIAGGTYFDPNNPTVPLHSQDGALDLQTGEVRMSNGGTTAQPMPPKDKLVVGQTYQTKNGPAKWDGSKFNQG